VCDLPSADGTISVLELPVAGNYHMNEALRSRSDLYLFLRKSGWEAVEAVAVVRKPSRGPAWQRMKRARIVKPEEVYATYDLSNDTEARSLMERKGFSQAEIDAVLFRSHERNWPEGISQFGSRYERLQEFKRYKAYAAGTWGDKVLVVIPAAENRKMREPLRPAMDIYMVYASNAVSVSEGTGRKR
jgi:acetyl-CoA acetyltransferase